MQHIKFPKIIVLLASFNGEVYLNEQIESILNQKNVNVRILIRDDGSSDRTCILCDEWMKKDSRVNVIFDKIQTGTPAGNFYKLLLEVNKFDDFDYISFADQDDIWCSDKLAKAITAMGESNSGYSSNLFAFSAELGKTWTVRKSSQQTQYDYIFQGASAGCTYVLKANVLPFILKAIGGTKFEILKYVSHDWLIYAVVRAAGLNWFIDNSSYIFYRQHLSNSYGDVRGFLLLKKKWHLFKSGWYRDQIVLITSLITQNSTVVFFRKNILNGNNLAKLRHISFFYKSRRTYSESIVIILMTVFGFL